MTMKTTPSFLWLALRETSKRKSPATRNHNHMMFHSRPIIATTASQYDAPIPGVHKGNYFHRVMYRRKRDLAMVVTAAACACIHFPARYNNSGFFVGATGGEHRYMRHAERNNWFESYATSSTRRMYHDATNDATTSKSTTPLSKVVFKLAERLREPVPLRATTTTPSSTANQRQRLTELVDKIVRGYVFLPPLDGSSTCERFRILEFLAKECGPNEEDIHRAFDDYCRRSKTNSTQEHVRRNKDFFVVKESTTPVYERMMDLAMKMDALQGMEFLIAIREDLLTVLRRSDKQNQTFWALKDLDDSLKSMLMRWFVKGLLVHKRITYESAPASLVEAVAKAEAVHPMQSLDDLKQRLSPKSKRVFGLFHPLLPNQLLVVVHAALLESIPNSMTNVVSNSGVNCPEVAAFYSISNGVQGLAGVGLGEILLKESIKALKEEIPSLTTFVTLSPIPGFRNWIQVQCRLKQQQQQLSDSNETMDNALIPLQDQETLMNYGLVSSVHPFPWEEFLENLENFDFAVLAAAAQDLDQETEPAPQKVDDDPTASVNEHIRTQQGFVLRRVLLRLASRYLAVEKHRGKPLDKVCRFHVSNGAEIHEVRFLADMSRGGRSKSYCLMVNYLYNLGTLEENQRHYESEEFAVPVGTGVQQWLE